MDIKLAYIRLKKDKKLYWNNKEVRLPAILDRLIRGKGPNSTISVKIGSIIPMKDEEPDNK
jgi:hypothetical protein